MEFWNLFNEVVDFGLNWLWMIWGRLFLVLVLLLISMLLLHWSTGRQRY